MDTEKREIRSLSDRVGSVAGRRDLKEPETTKTSSKTGFLNKWRNDWACTQLDSHTNWIHSPIGELNCQIRKSHSISAGTHSLGLCLNKWRRGRGFGQPGLIPRKRKIFLLINDKTQSEDWVSK
ncbi:hypothetical protein M445_26610 [Vibrio owensii 47666-1]|nr:hypothetical protein M445_26610 [Vibrio owensii 47666-1]